VEDARRNQCKEGKHKDCYEHGQRASEPHRFVSRRRRRLENVRVRGGSVRNWRLATGRDAVPAAVSAPAAS
jgi:hypothetical protein